MAACARLSNKTIPKTRKQTKNPISHIKVFGQQHTMQGHLECKQSRNTQVHTLCRLHRKKRHSCTKRPLQNSTFLTSYTSVIQVGKNVNKLIQKVYFDLFPKIV